MNHNQFPSMNEDPLAGDVDRYVPLDETRSDEQIERDEQIANHLHMSGDDGSDEYWADYDEYFGTVNGGQPAPETEPETTPRTTIDFSKRTPGLMTVTTPKGRSISIGTDWLDHDYLGMSHEEIGQKIDDEEDESEAHKKQEAENDAAWGVEPDRYYEEDEKIEDPLAGDVDRYVDPSETRGF